MSTSVDEFAHEFEHKAWRVEQAVRDTQRPMSKPRREAIREFAQIFAFRMRHRTVDFIAEHAERSMSGRACADPTKRHLWTEAEARLCGRLARLFATRAPETTA